MGNNLIKTTYNLGLALALALSLSLSMSRLPYRTDSCLWGLGSILYAPSPLSFLLLYTSLDRSFSFLFSFPSLVREDEPRTFTCLHPPKVWLDYEGVEEAWGDRQRIWKENIGNRSGFPAGWGCGRWWGCKARIGWERSNPNNSPVSSTSDS